MAYERREFKGAAPATTLLAGISDSATSFTVASSGGTGYPTGGANGDFFVVIDRGLSSEEKIRCSSRSGDVFTVATSGRGADNTAAASHATAAVVELTFTALDASEANYTVAETVGKITTTGDLLLADGANSLARLGIGTSGYALTSNGTTAAWATVGTAGIANTAVTADKIATAVAGDGLTGGGGSALAVNPDGSTLEISSDQVRVKDGGITKQKIAAAGRYQRERFSKSGALTVETYGFRWYPEANATIVSAWASVGTAPTGANLLVDIFKTSDSTSLWSSAANKPIIAASGFYDASAACDQNNTLTAGTDYLRVGVTQIGSTIAGSDLVVGILWYET